MRIIHITEAASAGVLSSVTTLARTQAAHPNFQQVTVGYLARPDSPSAAEIARMCGAQVTVIAYPHRRWRRVGDLLRLSVLLLRGDRQAVVHLHSSRAGFLGRLIAAITRSSQRVVYSPHCFSFDRSDVGPVGRVVYLALERLALHLGKRLILVSASEAEVARTLLPGSRRAIIANSVDAHAFSAQPRVGEPASVQRACGPQVTAPRAGGLVSAAGPQRIVHIGRIAGQKRPREFSAIAQTVTRARPGTEFIWIGDGQRPLLIPEQGAEPHIQITGWLDPSHVRAYLASATLLLFTSAGEGLPMSVLEAQALGIPVVAHAVTGIEDIVRDGETGILGHTRAELSAAVISLLDDPARARALGQAGARYVSTHFTTQNLAAHSLQAYRAVLSPAQLAATDTCTTELPATEACTTEPRTTAACTTKPRTVEGEPLRS